MNQAHRKGLQEGRKEEAAVANLLIESRLKVLLVALHKAHPEVFTEAQHEVNGLARVYWHLGYVAALKDVQRTLKARSWSVDAASPTMIDLPDDDDS